MRTASAAPQASTKGCAPVSKPMLRDCQSHQLRRRESETIATPSATIGGVLFHTTPSGHPERVPGSGSPPAMVRIRCNDCCASMHEASDQRRTPVAASMAAARRRDSRRQDHTRRIRGPPELGWLLISNLQSPLSTWRLEIRDSRYDMSVIWAKVWFDLWHNKVRTLLAVLSISAGVFAVGAMFGMAAESGAGRTARGSPA